MRDWLSLSDTDCDPAALGELIELAWSAVLESFHSRKSHQLFHYFANLVFNPWTLSSPQLADKLLSIFGRIEAKSQTRHGMMLPVIRAYFDSVANPATIPAILKAALLAGTGFNR